MNQGDPVGSPFHALDGIWQDGCVIVDGSDGSLTGTSASSPHSR
jgi:uncharacterized protein YukJ